MKLTATQRIVLYILNVEYGAALNRIVLDGDESRPYWSYAHTQNTLNRGTCESLLKRGYIYRNPDNHYYYITPAGRTALREAGEGK